MNDLARPDLAEPAAASTDDEIPPAEQFVNLVTENPLPAVLAAAAVGAGLMALASMMAGSRPSIEVPKVKVPKVKVPDEVDDQVKSLKSQLADLAKSVLAALPSKGEARDRASDAGDTAETAAKSAHEALSDSIKSASDSWKTATSTAGTSLKSAGDTLRSALGDTWDQASDVLQKYQPQVEAVGKLARQNPMWAAVLAGVAGTLIGWQVLGASKDD